MALNPLGDVRVPHGARASPEKERPVKTIIRFIETCRDEELRAFLAHCQAQENAADPELRRMAIKARRRAQEEQLARAFLHDLRRQAKGDE